jgi:hypothetical protein
MVLSVSYSTVVSGIYSDPNSRKGSGNTQTIIGSVWLVAMAISLFLALSHYRSTTLLHYCLTIAVPHLQVPEGEGTGGVESSGPVLARRSGVEEDCLGPGEPAPDSCWPSVKLNRLAASAATAGAVWIPVSQVLPAVLFSVRILSLWGAVGVRWSRMNRLDRCFACLLNPLLGPVPE